MVNQRNKYYIGGIIYSPLEIIKIAFDFGWVFRAKTEASKTLSAVELAVMFLKAKNVTIDIITEPLNVIEVDFKESKIAPPEVKQIPIQSVSAAKTDNTIMTILLNDAIYTVDTKLLSKECWDVQIFGSMGCLQCPFKNKDSCFGKEVISNSKNMLGNMIPVAKLIALREKRT